MFNIKSVNPIILECDRLKVSIQRETQ